MKKKLTEQEQLQKRLNTAASKLAGQFGTIHAKVILCLDNGAVIEGGTAPMSNEDLYQAMYQYAAHVTAAAQSEHFQKTKPYLNS